ncbi:hypothetical protein BD626DRAFT_51951 [Schizophyllum amplum]|uniref:Late embryogenesis abundant protein LEA-2 subgroup domain-containing protein n=1 Tax=Schizophyllum amplum TaxID=97359 RepID=A0A550CCT0_9AGAR|nr:hypothetical protein BD626DRAFT_51951 [Auriculariopsis ampla]
MSYRDPYAGNHHHTQSEDYNPYSGNAQPHATYEPGGYESYGNYGTEGYRDEPFDPNTHAANQHNTYGGAAAPAPPPKDEDQRSGFDRDEFVAAEKPKPRYRDYDENRWTKGGRGRCIGRFFCCTLMTAVFLILSILLALALWIRPPNIVVGELDTTSGSGGSVVQFSSDGLKINLAVNISVTNPNYFGVSLSDVTADLKYPIDGDDKDVGGGSLDNVDFPSHTTKDIKFPFSIDYQLTDDPDYSVLMDLVSKCGLSGSSSGEITVDYKIKLGIKFLFINVSPSISNSYSFACPIDTSNAGDLEVSMAYCLDRFIMLTLSRLCLRPQESTSTTLEASPTDPLELVWQGDIHLLTLPVVLRMYTNLQPTD